MAEIIEMVGELFLTAIITKKKGWFLAFFIGILGLIVYAYFNR